MSAEWALISGIIVGENLRPQQRRGRHDRDGGRETTYAGACYERGLRTFTFTFCRVLACDVTQLLSPSQVDTNKDRLVSLEEFLVATRKKDFLEPDSWEVMWHWKVDRAEEKENSFVGIGRHIFCVSLDVGAESGLYRRGNERVRGAPHSAGAGPEHEGCRPPETEKRSGATTGRAQRPEGWATTGKQPWFGANFSEKDNIMYNETLLIVATL